jgi:flagellar FliL protein
MADDELTEDPVEVAGDDKKKNLIIFVGALLVAIGTSVGGTVFFLSEAEAPAEEVVEVVVEPPTLAIYHNMRPPYIINYVTGAKPRYLQAEFSVMARDSQAIEAVVSHMPLIRSEIVSFLTDQNFLELQTQEGKNEMRKGIVNIVNDVLTRFDVQPGVENAFITSFVLQ